MHGRTFLIAKNKMVSGDVIVSATATTTCALSAQELLKNYTAGRPGTQASLQLPSQDHVMQTSVEYYDSALSILSPAVRVLRMLWVLIAIRR